MFFFTQFSTSETSPEILCPVWGTILQKRVDKLKRVQRGTTKMISGLENMTSEERVEEPG